MTQGVSWREEYSAIVERLPRIVDGSRLTVGGFSTFVDIYLSVKGALDPLTVAPYESAKGATMLADLFRRASSGVGGELRVNWPEGPAWMDKHVAGRRAVGGTSAQAAFMLAELGASALIAVEHRSAVQLEVLHPRTLLATERGVVPASSVEPDGEQRAPHYIFEFTAGETIGDTTVPRSSRTIVRFEDSPLQRDAAFVAASVERAADAGAGILCGFNEIPSEGVDEELDYACGVADAWRRAGLALIHVELGDFADLAIRDKTVSRLLPNASSLGMSLSELERFNRDGEPPEATAMRLAETYDLERVCVHADEWAFAVTKGDAEREREALQVGCLLASTRASKGYFAVPDRLPDGAQILPPPLPVSLPCGEWTVVCCPAPYLEKPAATIGLGDTFLAGTLLVLGGRTGPAPGRSVRSANAHGYATATR